MPAFPFAKVSDLLRLIDSFSGSLLLFGGVGDGLSAIVNTNKSPLPHTKSAAMKEATNSEIFQTVSPHPASAQAAELIIEVAEDPLY